VSQAPVEPRLVLVAALDRGRGIGRGNALPWRLPDDLRRFKALTLGHPLLMGRKTAQSLGRALRAAPTWC
jgi:dihydrofolate reductase